MPDLSQAKESSDVYLVEADEPGEPARKIVELVCRRIPAQFGLDPIREMRLLDSRDEGQWSNCINGCAAEPYWT